METYYIRPYTAQAKVTFDWVNYIAASKYAEARRVRAKHRHAKRRRNR